MRPEDLPYLKGDSTKIRTTLGWSPSFTIEETLRDMADDWLDVLQNKKSNR